LGKNSKGFYGIVHAKYKGYEKLAFFDRYLAFLVSKTVRDTATVTMEDE